MNRCVGLLAGWKMMQDKNMNGVFVRHTFPRLLHERDLGLQMNQDNGMDGCVCVAR